MTYHNQTITNIMSELNIQLELLDRTSDTTNESDTEKCPDLCPYIFGRPRDNIIKQKVNFLFCDVSREPT